MKREERKNIRIPYHRTKEGIAIQVRVEPRSSKRGIAGVMDNDVVKVKLTAPPVEGEANAQLIEVISEATGVRKSAIRIARGTSSKNKVVEILGVDGL